MKDEPVCNDAVELPMYPDWIGPVNPLLPLSATGPGPPPTPPI